MVALLQRSLPSIAPVCWASLSAGSGAHRYFLHRRPILKCVSVCLTRTNPSSRCIQSLSSVSEKQDSGIALGLIEQKCGDDTELVPRGSCEKIRKTSWVAALLLCLAFTFQGVEPVLAFTFFGEPAQEKDPVEPFTLYGSVLKKYMIEQIVDGKIVGRKKGFTVSACVRALDASKETPEVVGLPAGLKVTISGEASCFKGVAQNRDDACRPPCKAACLAAVNQHIEEVKQSTGYTFDSSDAAKAAEACASQCFNECSKPGTSIAFVVPIRPRR